MNAIAIRHQPQPPSEPFNHNSMFTPRHVILKNKYRLTNKHVGDSGNIPLIEVSVEGAIILKHCHKKGRQISFTVNARKEGRRTLIKYCGKKRWQTSFTTNFHWPISTYSIVAFSQLFLMNDFASHPRHQPEPRVSLPITTLSDILETYRLTSIHCSYSGNVPLIEILVEAGSLYNRCRKKKRQILFSFNAIKEAEGRSLIK
jgi:hypothetical protein